MIVFADARAEDKVRSLFDLFDFNEVQSISTMDLEFLLQSVLVSTAKIFNLGQDISASELSELIGRTFQEGARLSLPQLLAWCSRTEEVQGYLAKFSLEGLQAVPLPETKESKKPEASDLDCGFPPGSGSSDSRKVAFISQPAAMLVDNKRQMNFRAWLHTALQPLIAYRLEAVTMNNYLKATNEVKLQMEWAYGIRCNDTKRSLQYTVGKMFAESVGTRTRYEKKMMDGNEELVYFVSNIAILLNVRLNRQRFYTQHQNEIISLAVSNLNGDFIATGELAHTGKPAMHIWSSRTLDNLNVLRGIHPRGVHLLAFSSDDRFLISCGLQDRAAVLIHDWAAGTVVVSCSLLSPAQDLVVLHGSSQSELDGPQGGKQQAPALQDEPSSRVLDGFVIVSLHDLVVFVFDKSKKQYSTSYVALEQAAVHTSAPPLCAMSLLTDYKNRHFKPGSSEQTKVKVIAGQEDDAFTLD